MKKRRFRWQAPSARSTGRTSSPRAGARVSPLRLAVLFREGRSHPLLEKVWAHLPVVMGPERAIPGLSVINAVGMRVSPAHLLVPHDRVQPGRYGRQGISLPGDGDPVLDQGPMGRCTTV